MTDRIDGFKDDLQEDLIDKKRPVPLSLRKRGGNNCAMPTYREAMYLSCTSILWFGSNVPPS